MPAATIPVVEELRHWMTAVALPLWGTRGFDANRGGFHERLLLDGQPDLAAPRRSMVQARQIIVYAQAGVLGWYPEGLNLAQSALEFLLKEFRSPDGAPGYVHSVRPEGGLADAMRDTYGHAFLLLALAWLTKASADAQLPKLIDEVLAFIDERLTAADGTLIEGVPPSLPRRQNPHMHAYEAMLALHELTGSPGALIRADRFRNLLITRFLHANSGTLTEFFDGEWRPYDDGSGIQVEPGHHAEWSSLLHRHDVLTSSVSSDLPDQLLSFAARTADPVTGFVPDGVTRAGETVLPTRRLWPQTEMVKAWLARYERGDEAAFAGASTLLTSIQRDYVDKPIPGAWIDHADHQGRLIGPFIPASAMYHLFGCIAEADRVMSRRLS